MPSGGEIRIPGKQGSDMASTVTRSLNTARRLSMCSVKSFFERSGSVAVKKNVPPVRRDAFHFPALRPLNFKINLISI
jgi:hypothetical protein